MRRKWPLIAVTTLLAIVFLAPPAMATHKPGHDYPPGCFNEPPPHARDHKCWKHGFSDAPEGKASLARLRQTLHTSFSQEATGITVWMIVLVAMGSFTVALMVDHRRRAQALRRRIRP